jgi:uncharacterized protein (DUF1499 family)
MMAWIKLVVVAAVGLLGAGRMGFLKGQAPTDLGLVNGRLKPPSYTDNSLSSQAKLYTDHPMRDKAHIEPLALHGNGEETLARLEKLVTQTAGGVVVERQNAYLRAEFTSRWLRFVDDAEFWFNPAEQVIEVRAASRLGQKDFGVNRARMEALRVQLARP